jgi:metal-responsive CopG/Arc/MetJ family transcriptional regulator
MTVKNLVRITISLEPKMVDKLMEVQKKVGIFNRPEMYRQVVKAGLEKMEKAVGE